MENSLKGRDKKGEKTVWKWLFLLRNSLDQGGEANQGI